MKIKIGDYEIVDEQNIIEFYDSEEHSVFWFEKNEKNFDKIINFLEKAKEKSKNIKSKVLVRTDIADIIYYENRNNTTNNKRKAKRFTIDEANKLMTNPNISKVYSIRNYSCFN